MSTLLDDRNRLLGELAETPADEPYDPDVLLALLKTTLKLAKEGHFQQSIDVPLA